MKVKAYYYFFAFLVFLTVRFFATGFFAFTVFFTAFFTGFLTIFFTGFFTFFTAFFTDFFATVFLVFFGAMDEFTTFQ